MSWAKMGSMDPIRGDDHYVDPYGKFRFRPRLARALRGRHECGQRRGPGTRRDCRPDLTLEVRNEVGQLVITYTLFSCWVSQYETVPDLDATANPVVIASIRLENEGWERADAVSEPTEPIFD